MQPFLAPRWKTGKRGVEDAAPYADIFPFFQSKVGGNPDIQTDKTGIFSPAAK